MVLQCNAPDTNACTLAVTDHSGFGTTVWDVNPAIFANADQGLSRPNTIVWDGGFSRGVGLGKRSAELGGDGKAVSAISPGVADPSLPRSMDQRPSGTPARLPRVPMGFAIIGLVFEELPRELFAAVDRARRIDPASVAVEVGIKLVRRSPEHPLSNP
jgi:hypothetical protein